MRRRGHPAIRNPLIVFSGLDGAGKSTQISLLLDFLKASGLSPILLWTRGGYTPTFNRLKDWFRRLSRGRALPEPGHSPRRAKAFSRSGVRRLWLSIALLDLLWVYVIQVRFWRWRGRSVVCDRYLLDTLIDFRLNFPQETVETWHFWRLLRRLTPRPDAGFFLLVPVAESVRRSRDKKEPFPEAPEKLVQRLGYYEALSEEGHWRVLDGLRPVSELAAEVRATLQALPLAKKAAMI